MRLGFGNFEASVSNLLSMSSFLQGFRNGREHVSGLMWSQMRALSDPSIDGELGLYGDIVPFGI